MSGLSFREMNPVRLGMIGTLGVVVALAVALNSGAIVAFVTQRGVSADFAEAGGLNVGDTVRVGGSKVGEVTGIALDGAQVKVSLNVDKDVKLGTRTSAAVRTDTPLGKKFVSLTPAGSGELDDVIPLARTTSAYDITEALSDLTNTAGQLDTAQLGKALQTASTAFQHTPDGLRDALSGVTQLSQTIASRDQALQILLAHANNVTGVLATRKDQITTLLADGNVILAELQSRSADIHRLLVNVTAVSQQLDGLVADNDTQLKPALDQLKGVLDMLNANDHNIQLALQRAAPFVRSLGEAVGSGSFYMAYVENIAPTDMTPIVGQLLKGSK